MMESGSDCGPTSPDPHLGKGVRESNPDQTIQIDLYGIKAKSELAPLETPRSWKEVWRSVHDALMSISADVAGLIADTLRTGRRIVRGIGLPSQSTRRSSDLALQQAEQLEYRAQETEGVQDSQHALASLDAITKNLKSRGISLTVCRTSEGRFVVVLLPGDEVASGYELGRDSFPHDLEQLSDPAREDQ